MAKRLRKGGSPSPKDQTSGDVIEKSSPSTQEEDAMADKSLRIDPDTLPRATGIVEKIEPPQTEFSKVLTKLANDSGYREKATYDPSIITRDFKLALKELQALRQVAIMSGADCRAINKFRAGEFAARADLLCDVDVSCCSCCCCCCGETAVAPMIYG